MLSSLVLTILFSLTTDVFAQKMEYTYDATGNRIKKEIVLGEDDGDLGEGYRKKLVFEDVISEEIIKIYPNPTKGVLKIELPDALLENSSIRLLNLTGNVIIEQNNMTKINELNITNEAKGNYILQLISNEEVSNWKIIKQ